MFYPSIVYDGIVYGVRRPDLGKTAKICKNLHKSVHNFVQIVVVDVVKMEITILKNRICLEKKKNGKQIALSTPLPVSVHLYQ